MNFITGNASSLFEIFFVLILLCAIYLLIEYLCQSIGLYRVAGKLGKDKRWMAFVPILNIYLIGRCVDEDDPYILHAGWVATLVNIFMALFVDNIYIVLFGSFLLTVAVVYYIYQVSIKLGSSGVPQAILTFLGFGPFVYLYLGLKDEKKIDVLKEEEETEEESSMVVKEGIDDEPKLNPEHDLNDDIDEKEN